MAKDKKQAAQPKAEGKKGKQAAKGTEKKKKPEKVEIPALPKDYVPRLMELYSKQISVSLNKKFNYRNVNIIPRLTKIVLNVGIGTLHQDAKLAESITEELGLISGQKPIFTKAKKSISNFKLREGMTIGCCVTLRRERMYEFFDRLITYVIPRIRDFRGLSDRSFDGRGNYTFGIKEQIIFPEIDYDKVVSIHGMDITICTTAKNDEEAKELLKGFGFPFRTISTQTGKDAA
ncbi:50S ribosomal protein L5 [bacterium]|nr:50S ribosomal protein L5 [bacterium]